MSKLSRISLKRNLFYVACLFALGTSRLVAAPVGLRVNGIHNPLGIDSQVPSLSWRSDDAARNWVQSAYRIQVATNLELLNADKPDVWDSQRVSSNESVGISYGGPALVAAKRYFWRVRTWDRAGRQEESKNSAWWEMGLLGPHAWQAHWISYADAMETDALSRVQWLWLPGEDAQHVRGQERAEFRHVLHLDEKPEWAILHCLTGGEFVTEVNGTKTGRKEEWGAFDRENILKQLRAGKGSSGDNEILVRTIARGAESGKTVPNAFAAVLAIRDSHGHAELKVTDAGWSTRSGDAGQWQQAQVVGPLTSLKVNTGSDRYTLVPAPDRISTTVALLRKKFSAARKIASARLYVTAMGSYKAFLNGAPVGDGVLNPGFTDFRKRVLYQTYDVTSQVHPGENVLRAKLAGGWHGSPLLWSGTREFSGPDALRAELIIRFTDGTEQTVSTDTSWQGKLDATDSSEIYGGESYDARLAQQSWSTANHSTGSGWGGVQEEAISPDVQITAQPDLAPHVSQVLRPISVKTETSSNVPTGTKLFDMGQNMVGTVRLQVRGERGTTIRLRFAERLQADGSAYTENLRDADATDEYTLRGSGVEEWTPEFTFHGFRYVEVEGLREDAGIDTLEGQVINSLPDKPSVRFSSSSELLNHMYELGLWGQRGNFLSIPTDCPQRDERMGWMGDAGVFWRTGSYNFDIESFTHKFMGDVVDGQTKQGIVGNISPNLLNLGSEIVGAPGWGDAAVIVPYATWLQYGDRSIINENWSAMERWMDFIERTNPDGLRKKELGPNYGDWLAPDPNTPRDLVATAYWALIAQQMQEMAKATGRSNEAEKYGKLYEKIRAAYMKAYLHHGEAEGNTQTAYVVTLYAGLSEPEQRQELTQRLVADIERHGNHLTTGFLGTPFLLFVLDAEGRSDVAFRLLLNDTYPSWGYMVSKGATTWWERWNGDTGDPSMNSYNHYAFGSVMAWVYRRVSGIDADAAGPGFHHLVIAPHADAGLTHARTEYDSAYGTVTTDWKLSDDGTFHLSVSLPANTTATVYLPKGPRGVVMEDGVVKAQSPINIGSGQVNFVAQ